MRVCPRCEVTTDESRTFCPDCGTSFGVAVDPTAATGALEAQPPTIDLRGGEQAAEGSFSGPAGPAGVAGVAAGSNLVGYTIDRQFVVEAELGGGAFGTVYRGRQLGLDRVIAIKVPTHEIASDPVMAKRFAREARAAARIQHPGVVAIHAVGELADGRPYLVMQFVEGQPLDRILADGPILPGRALRIVRAVASALTETHAAGVVHRDLKPSNIMWQRDRNGDDRVTIVDFGIAASKPGTADASRLTAHGLIGTPHYMSPEQAHGETVDARADLYALGCLLFELVTDAPPFEGSAFEVLLAHLGRPPPAPSARNPALPEVIDGLCMHLLAKSPDDRPQAADEVVTLIDVALAELASGDSVARTARRPRRKRRASAAARARGDGAAVVDDYLAEVAGDSEPPPRRRRTALQLALGGLAGVALATAGFVVWNRGLPSPASEPAADDDGADPGSAVRYHQIDQDDGEIVIHVQVPDPIVANTLVRPRIEIKNKLGQPIKTPELVVTVSDESGPTGLVAHPRRSGPGYAFRYTFPRAGRYTLKVFPPSVASAFEIPLDVR